MKRIFVTIFISALYLAVTPGFHCGNPPYDCVNYRTDTAAMHFSVTNPATFYHVNDTVHVFSKISDTIKPLAGSSFIYALDRLNIHVNLYKVINTSTSPQLVYANNEFNAQVQTGYFQNTGATGFEITYQRGLPLNTLQASFVPGQPGLYLVKATLNTYSAGYDLDLYHPTNHCNSYKGIADIPDAQQQRQYWDTIGVTTLALTNNSYPYITKTDRNYFFVNVLP